MSVNRSLVLMVLLSLVGLLPRAGFADQPARETGPRETAEQRDERMAWWREARFGMFIHWGLYAIPAGTWEGRQIGGIGEWIMDRANIPVQDYEKLAARFNPVKYDAAEWVRTAKAAGMRYLVITSKHHDGFCLFDTDATDYNVVDAAPYNRDLLKPLAEECRKQGLKFCVYYSIMDWHHPSQFRANENRYNPTQMHEEKKAEYIAFMKQQLKELLDTCDPEVLWFDGEWPGWYTEEDGREIYAFLRKLKPELIVNNRVGKGRKGMEGLNRGDQEYVGDFGTPEQQIPATGLPGVDWESCMTMNDTWGYKSYDHKWKSTEMLIRNLVDIASKGGNYLLNVGPTAEGEIPAASVERMLAIGKWMDVNGESVWGTEASPFKRTPWGRCTQKSLEGGRTRLFLHLFQPPENGKLVIPGLVNKTISARLLNRDRPLDVSVSDGKVTIVVPLPLPDAIDTVIQLDIQGAPKIAVWIPAQDRDGALHLDAVNAVCHGEQIRYEARSDRKCIGYWLDPRDWVQWRCQLERPGRFAVHAVVAAEASAEFTLEVAEQKLAATVPVTGDYGEFTTLVLGNIHLPEPGSLTVNVRAIAGDWHPFNLRSVTLKPL